MKTTGPMKGEKPDKKQTVLTEQTLVLDMKFREENLIMSIARDRYFENDCRKHRKVVKL
jgi:hypothetical protein